MSGKLPLAQRPLSTHDAPFAGRVLNDSFCKNLPFAQREDLWEQNRHTLHSAGLASLPISARP
jgi:hypothetical protein